MHLQYVFESVCKYALAIRGARTTISKSFPKSSRANGTSVPVYVYAVTLTRLCGRRVVELNLKDENRYSNRTKTLRVPNLGVQLLSLRVKSWDLWGHLPRSAYSWCMDASVPRLSICLSDFHHFLSFLQFFSFLQADVHVFDEFLHVLFYPQCYFSILTLYVCQDNELRDGLGNFENNVTSLCRDPN